MAIREQGQGMSESSLSFSALQARIEQIPEGPAEVLNTPRWLRCLNVLGTVAIIFGITPFLLVQWIEPRDWMVWMARIGAAAAGLLFAPMLLRGLWLTLREFAGWKRKLIRQSDHDLEQFREVRRWLLRFPREQVVDHHRFASFARQRVTSKVGLLAGSADRLGMLPIATALFLLVREAHGLGLEGLLDTPLWIALLGLFLAFTWGIGAMAAQMRLHLELHEMILADALAARDVREALID